MAILRHTISKIENAFLADVLAGLSSNPKSLPSKYFYNQRGDEIFAEIMQSPDYYVTACEMEIFETQSKAIAEFVMENQPFDLVELGPGNGLKTKHLLSYLLHVKADFTYYPVDISQNIIRQLKSEFDEFFFLKMNGINDEYVAGLEKINSMSSLPKVVLFCGSSIGNMSECETIGLLKVINSKLRKGDKLILGMDLKKDPRLIITAYDDAEGLTREFNLNLLHRINEELDADFNVSAFYHFPIYDPVSGECKSYLISRREQKVRLMGNHVISFEKNEPILMEISHKFSPEELETMALMTGFDIRHNFTDSKKWFVDSVWEKTADI